ncbi:hypothetical protein BAUCODRAFT_70614 [Baudoinia panamericana UAMH 10762]|uniref:F-box domain-containing protein n=1 Tax=Baudoinia panamericana (strain UAMH 10762) TaxID=717646 RepID=M2MXN5_BAUPA|nr:uncharacterized protein BAUCODRAFT_70614 [Baudoinia panamericana UAMH 10762]EMC96333.1 hypothetical protein BAUCODRAFT_70614 [Baudoinia panamericana UAMH 10762]
MKRQRDADEIVLQPATKRTKTSRVDHLSRLSDELILRVLGALSVSQLIVCERLSRKYRSLAGDNSLWKGLYYHNFVRPRATRLRQSRDRDEVDGDRFLSSGGSRWLDDEHLVRHEGRTNWKKQFRLRQNWQKGSAVVNEIQVAEEASVPPTLVQMNDGIIYMADRTGLRAWSAKGSRKMVAQTSLEALNGSPPTTLAVGPGLDDETTTDTTAIIVGSQSGAFSVFTLDKREADLCHLCTHEPSTSGTISSAAIAWPYVVTMTATQSLSFYRFPERPRHTNNRVQPRLLHSLKSQTVYPPLSVSLRPSPSTITVCIAYTLPTYLSGWTFGLQEIRVTPGGDFLGSRTASAIDQHYRPLAFAIPPMIHHITATQGSLATATTLELRHIHSKPTTISYAHPYLLVSHPDNTLTLYLVKSNAETLHISPGSRLWGHTSSVSGAHVGGRGKAVSVSQRGDELRLWELEGGFVSSAARKRLASGDLSVQVQPSVATSTSQRPGQGDPNTLGLAMSVRSSCAREQSSSELTLTRGWIGFDEENVVVLEEQSQGRQALLVYDFT